MNFLCFYLPNMYQGQMQGPRLDVMAYSAGDVTTNNFKQGKINTCMDRADPFDFLIFTFDFLCRSRLALELASLAQR